MQNYKIIVLLKSFSLKELRELEKFSNSDYYGRDRNLIPLLKVFKKQYPNFGDSDFTNKNVYSSLYPGQDYNDSNFRALCSKLYKMCLDFIAVNSFRADKALYNRILAQTLFVRRNFPQMEKQLQLCLNNLDKNKNINDEYFLEK